MKRQKRITIFLLLGLIFIIVIYSTRQKPHLSTQLPTPTRGEQPRIPERTIVYDNRTYAYRYFIVDSLQSLQLIPNFTEKLTSTDLAATYSCTYGINGGFYDTNNLPLGGFMTKKTVMKKPVHNRLIDGFLWGTNKRAFITLSEPQDDSLFYLQAGPLLMINGGVTHIFIGNDEYKRRSIAGLTDKGSLLFLTLYNPESVYEGPLLSDMPSILRELNKTGDVRIYDAVNLDGGSASAYISQDRTLQEFSSIGSFFCVQ